jgi:hypothetical protein
MLLAYHNRPVNINAFITFAIPEEEMTKANRKGRLILDAGSQVSTRRSMHWHTVHQSTPPLF